MPDDEPWQAGVPTMQRLQPKPTVASAKEEPVVTRLPIHEAGIPVGAPRSIRPLTQADEAEIEQARAARAEAAFQEMLQQPNASPFTQILATCNVVVGYLLILVVGAFLLWAASQSIHLIAAMSQLPPTLRVAGFIVLGLIFGAVAIAAARLMWLYGKLKTRQQVALRQWKDLERRSELRAAARRRQLDAVEKLKVYLADYPLTDPAQQRSLRDGGLTSEEIERLGSLKAALLRQNRPETDESWLADFTTQFQSTLDKAANVSIRNIARHVGVKTALSPNPLVDGAILVYSGFRMLEQLCRIYNLKLGPLAMLRLIGWVFTQAYFAGKLEQFTDAPEDLIQDWLSEAFQSAGLVASGALSKVIGSAAARGAQGYANAIMVNRLGQTAKRLLRPADAA